MPSSTSAGYHALQQLHSAIQAIVDDVASEHGAAGTPRVELTRPSEERFGDFATNVALLLAPLVGRNPREVGTGIAERVAALEGVRSAEVAGPGFVNLVVSDPWLLEVHASVLAAGDQYGAGTVERAERILLEFVSANPTGPLTAASARHAAYGDSLARLLRHVGHDVSTEFYVNDFGRQVRLFGESLAARVRGTDVPEDGYQGEYVAELARELGADPEDDPAELGARGVERMVAAARSTLEDFRAPFDHFQSERQLHEDGRVREGVERVRAEGQSYEEEGALWLRTTSYGDDKDRVLVRADGTPTYFASDVGYLLDKAGRGYERAMFVLGADHHGYVARLRAAMSAIGRDPDACEVLILQMVNLLEGGEQKRMAKRRGDFVSMQELIDLVGVDAGRFFMLQRSHDQALDIDLQLAAEQTAKNPVYYVQYAHARICSIMRKAEADGVSTDGFDASGYPDELHASERRLIKRLAEFPVLLRSAAERRAPHRLTFYAHDLASDFTQFYKDCRVMGEGVPAHATAMRLELCRAARTVIARSLELVGVTAPESM